MHKMSRKSTKKVTVSNLDWAILASYILVMFMLLPLLFASMFFTLLARALRWPVKYTLHDLFNTHEKRSKKKINELERIAKKIERRKRK